MPEDSSTRSNPAQSLFNQAVRWLVLLLFDAGVFVTCQGAGGAARICFHLRSSPAWPDDCTSGSPP